MANAAYKARANKHCKYIQFNLGDLVWLHLRKENFRSSRKSKLIVSGDSPFKVIERIGDNAYKLQLTRDMANFYVGHLSPYVQRANPLKEGEINVGYDANAKGKKGNQVVNT